MRVGAASRGPAPPQPARPRKHATALARECAGGEGGEDDGTLADHSDHARRNPGPGGEQSPGDEQALAAGMRTPRARNSAGGGAHGRGGGGRTRGGEPVALPPRLRGRAAWAAGLGGGGGNSSAAPRAGASTSTPGGRAAAPVMRGPVGVARGATKRKRAGGGGAGKGGHSAKVTKAKAPSRKAQASLLRIPISHSPRISLRHPQPTSSHNAFHPTTQAKGAPPPPTVWVLYSSLKRAKESSRNVLVEITEARALAEKLKGAGKVEGAPDVESIILELEDLCLQVAACFVPRGAEAAPAHSSLARAPRRGQSQQVDRACVLSAAPLLTSPPFTIVSPARGGVGGATAVGS
jgi:hypothetical protein